MNDNEPRITVDVPRYDAPTISDYGDLVEITAGSSTGVNLDASFPVGTPKNQLTFSVTP